MRSRPDGAEQRSGAGGRRELPRIARWAVRLCLPADRSDEALDDLVEAARARRRSGRSVTVWAWRQALAYLTRVPSAAAADTWRRRRRVRRHPHRLEAPRAPFTLEQLMDIWMQDLRYAVRGLYKSKAFTFFAVLTLGLGVRVALGANAGNVRRMVVRRGLLLAGGGVVIGLVLAVLASQGLAAYLLDVGATDPVTYGAVIAFLAVISALASYLPARRATRVDPLVALRDE